jgi:hypothetical protein
MNKFENIWTRQRLLQNEEKTLLGHMRQTFKQLGEALDNDCWRAAATCSDEITTQCIRQVELETELGGVNELVEGFDKLNERMERLEGKASAEGWDDYDK